jgi:hypothetical protein
MPEQSMSYISKKPCGCLAMAIVDNPEHKKDVAREIAKAIRAGETVERVTTESVRTMEWECPEHRKTVLGTVKVDKPEQLALQK